jgi:hypothetical protein
MPDDPGSADKHIRQAEVSPNNPCPFLRALVAEGFVGGHTVPLGNLSRTIAVASGEKGLQQTRVRLEAYLIALIANGVGPFRLLRSWWSGVQLDALRDGPLDKHGSGSRILNATAHVNEAEISRLAEFGSDQPDGSGGFERGLTLQEITPYMDANFERARPTRRRIDRLLMNGEWPVLLHIMGKGEGEKRYLSVAEVRTLFVERRLPDQIAERLRSQPVPAATRSPIRVLGKIALGAIAFVLAAIVAIIEFPDQVRNIAPRLLAQLLPPTLPDRASMSAAYWLDQNWSTEDRHWFHHATQGTATFPVPYAWFVALEQPGIRLLSNPGLLKDSDYLERFGFLPSPKTVRADEASLRPFGYSTSSDVKTEAAPPSVAGLLPTPVENFDGLPVGFARLTGVTDATTGHPQADKIGLTCAACHTGHINYRGISVRFDGGPAMLDLRKLESATALSILYTLKVPGRFERFAARVLGPDASPAARGQLKKDLSAIGDFLLNQKKIYDKTIAEKGQRDTEEGFGRLDALNRIGNEVFWLDLVRSGLAGFEKNLHADDAPVSFPPIWTVPWLKWAQYDASIEQPLIRNVGEALGVSAPVNLSPDHASENLFRSSVAIENLARIEAMLRGPSPFTREPNAFGGLISPKWPSHIFRDYQAWSLNPDRIARGRAIYAEICVECHLGPVDDPAFDKQFPEKSFWTAKNWNRTDPVLTPVMKGVAGMGTDPAQADVLWSRNVDVPGFLDIEPARDFEKWWQCPLPRDLPAAAWPTEMKFSLALMLVVDRVSRKWLHDKAPNTDPAGVWGLRKNCPNWVNQPHYRARPLNGVWATAPYLHNDSIPSLYWLLKPAAERPKQFCLGARDYDPQQVGYRVVAGETPNCNKGESLFSTTNSVGSSIHGNSVLGHSLEGTPGTGKPGVIGRLLSEDERYDLIEYLKTL